ncbi:MAG: putative short-chain dehydrogenase, partial [Paenibacillus sp.]|nr:putative short-chain dehydrogenase [Paenibacillus sp.]
MLLSGRKALITGAARGIGLAIAQRFAAEGCSVIMTDILQAEGEAAAQLMREQGKQARFIGMNVTDEQQVRQTFES